MKVKKIGLLGKGGSGKDEVANILRRKGYTFVAFSDGLYDICRNFYNMKEKDRALLQDVGKAMRSVNTDVFVNRALNDLKGHSMQGISDVRHVNEYEKLKNNGFKFVRIEASLPIRIDRIKSRDHISCDKEYVDRLENNPIENYLNDYPVDYTIVNEGSLEDLKTAVDKMLEKLEEV